MKCTNCMSINTKVNPDEPHLITCLNCGRVFENNFVDYRQYIKKQIEIKSLTIYSLAKAAELRSRRTLYKYLNGSDIRVTTLNKILKALKNLPNKK